MTLPQRVRLLLRSVLAQPTSGASHRKWSLLAVLCREAAIWSEYAPHVSASPTGFSAVALLSWEAAMWAKLLSAQPLLKPIGRHTPVVEAHLHGVPLGTDTSPGSPLSKNWVHCQKGKDLEKLFSNYFLKDPECHQRYSEVFSTSRWNFP